ncbi:MAG: hypothetical protein F4Y97_07345 [Dehalococcoidia bacterium]|nr:hypothetical protein [Dehalococcoidia bacterium]
MSEAIEAVVHFKVTVRSVEHEGYWTTKALETGIVTPGATRDEAEARNGEAHILLVRRVKRLGLVALAEFMDSHGVDYEIGEPAHTNRSVEQLPLAA